ncbi:NADH-quinone oxidoreductase subunit C [Candidatus Sulfurimonas marisnigri]|uniref:NADH-quinone oxidoreductase subunit C n=1 Tax=Candidatus Sulfurimonas marisnigri TaxID=2740405 RepID=A0A7S7RPW5_9BACT|nr:NADH-quinone oxidoreductase subunit C [Candidatus Sulfurimonas marisnigri]QOY53835.1 NADH-quinone oxidoreductase subunit C [Candidatus Sulfurimonas marisnigri]
MRKIEVSLENTIEKIKEFYTEKEWHFITLNGVALEDGKIEIQWMFSKYESLDEVVVFFTVINQGDVVPSVVDIIPSAIISQREIVDMFGVEVEGSSKGLYLDADSTQMPLSSCGVGA